MEKSINKIEKLDHFGRGITKINDKIAFIEDAITGDEVIVKITKEKSKFILGEIEEIKIKSPYRRDGFCKYCDVCGGCNICNMIYEKQLEYKESKVREIVKRYLNEDIKINPIIYSNEANYRNKITLHVDGDQLGLYEKKSNTLVEIDECKLVDCKINEIIKRLKFFIKNTEHNLKEIIIKKTTLDEVMIVIIGDIDKNTVLQSFSDIKSIYINDIALKEKTITEELGEFKFLISNDSFFQVNRFNTINLYNEVLRMLEGKIYKNVLDLYCGTGTISLFLSKTSQTVVGIEVVSSAIVSALENKKINNINNVKFINGKVEDYIDDFSNIDLIVVDPPRSGLDKKTIENILRIKPKDIVYVSCDPMTLVRDLNLLKEKYDILELTPVDMFPNTYHVECVCALKLKRNIDL